MLCFAACLAPQFVRKEIAIPLGLEDSFYMGRIHTRGVEEHRIASVEHVFNPNGPGLSGTGNDDGRSGSGDDEVVPGSRGIVSIEDLEMEGNEGQEEAARSGFLGILASVLKETDPAEAVAIEGFSRKLAGREYFLDPRVFNYRQVHYWAGEE